MRRTAIASVVLVLLTAGSTIVYFRNRGSGPTGVSGTTTARSVSDGPAAQAAATPPSLGNVTPRNLIYPEVKALRDRLGGDVPRLLAFVANDLACEPYSGALRGPRGTILAGSANAVDKALLLRDLLRLVAVPPEIRFAFATLPEADVAQLVGSCIRMPTVPSQGGLGLAGLSSDRRLLVERLVSQWKRSVSDVRDDAASVASVVDTHLLKPAASASSKSGEVTAARDHVWLQYRDGSSWIDLDPSILSAVPGARRVAPERTAAELPEDRYHHLSINIRVEERTDGRVSTRWVLRSTLRTAELAGSTISYGHAEPLGLAASVAVPNQRVTYTPVLVIDDEQRVGDPIELPPIPPGGGLAGAVGGGVVGLGGRLGEIMSRGVPSQKAAEESSGITGVWLELLMRAPEGRVRSDERPILDRIGYAARTRHEAETARLEPIPVSFGHYLPFTTVWNIGVWLGEKAIAAPLLNVGGTRGAWPALETLGALHRSFYLIRQSLFSSLSDSATSIASASNVSLLEWEYRRPGSLDGRLTIDVVDARIALRARASTTVPLGVLWGHASLGAERLLFMSRTLVTGQPGPISSDTPNVANVFAQARASGVPIRVLLAFDGKAADGIDASAEARARLRARLGEGYVAVVPERSVDVGPEKTIGWWLVEPGTTLLLDEMENGRRQGSIERPGVESTQSRGQTEAEREGFLQRFGRGVRCLSVAAKIILGLSEIGVGMQGGDPGAIESGIESVFDGVDGIAPSCAEGEGGLPGPPAGAGGRGPDPPRLPRFKP